MKAPQLKDQSIIGLVRGHTGINDGPFGSRVIEKLTVQLIGQADAEVPSFKCRSLFEDVTNL